MALVLLGGVAIKYSVYLVLNFKSFDPPPDIAGYRGISKSKHTGKLILVFLDSFRAGSLFRCKPEQVQSNCIELAVA